MEFLRGVFVEGWPILGALALVVVITYGAMRPYMKSDKRVDPNDEG